MRHASSFPALALICCGLLLPSALAVGQSPPADAAKSEPSSTPAQAEGSVEQQQEPATPHVSPLLAYQRQTLTQSLQAARRDRREVNTLLPLLITAAGAGIIVVGAILGVDSGIGCGGTCKGASAVPAWMMIGGTTLGIAGLVWSVRIGRELSQIDTREYRIKTELERLDWNAAPVPRASLSPTLSMRASF